MSEREQPARIGVRELRQNLSVYLDRVKADETLEVTEHGVPVAQLGPRPVERISRYEQLVAEGRITPATGDQRSLPYPPSLPGRPLGEILQQMRDEDDR
jgi:prevent-host-death family protein